MKIRAYLKMVTPIYLVFLLGTPIFVFLSITILDFLSGYEPFWHSYILIEQFKYAVLGIEIAVFLTVYGMQPIADYFFEGDLREW